MCLTKDAFFFSSLLINSWVVFKSESFFSTDALLRQDWRRSRRFYSSINCSSALSYWLSISLFSLRLVEARSFMMLCETSLINSKSMTWSNDCSILSSKSLSFVLLRDIFKIKFFIDRTFVIIWRWSRFSSSLSNIVWLFELSFTNVVWSSSWVRTLFFNSTRFDEQTLKPNSRVKAFELVHN